MTPKKQPTGYTVTREAPKPAKPAPAKKGGPCSDCGKKKASG